MSDEPLNDSQSESRPVLLSDVVSEMECMPEEWSAYLNRRTGTVVSLSMDAFSEGTVDDDDDPYYGDATEEMIALAAEIEESNDYLRLPGKFEINEWSIMRDFSASIQDETIRNELLDAIHGSGAFRFFKSTVARLGLRQDWFRYRDEAVEEVAIGWLEANNVSWTRKPPEA